MNTGTYDIKRIGVIAAGLMMVVLAFVVLVKTGIGSVTRLYKEMQSERKDITVIKDNIATLKKIDLAVVSKTDQVFITMPDRSLIPLVISNFKTEAADKFKTETVRSDTVSSKETISGLSLIYDGTSADIDTMINIIDAIQSYAPLTVVEKLDIKQNPLNYKVTLRIATFWSDLPKELPELKAPVSELTEEETRIMNEVTLFKKPSSSNLNPQGPVDRANPFI